MRLLGMNPTEAEVGERLDVCSVSGLRRRVLRFCVLRVWAFRRSDVDSLL